MNDWKKILLFLKENLTYTLLLIYSVSFVNYFFYYKSFNIPVFNYIGINDLLFFSIEYVFQLLLIILVYEFVIFIIFTFFHALIYENITLYKKGILKKYKDYSKRNRERIKNVFDENFPQLILKFKLWVAFLGMFVIAFLPHLLIIFPAYIVYFNYLISRISNDTNLRIFISISMIVVVVFMLLSTLNNAYDKRYKKDNTQISFKENSNIISTDRTYGCLNYLGETSSHIFLYDIEKRVSKIYSKSSISDFQIKDPGILDSLMFKIKRNPLIKSIVEEYSKK